MNLAAVKVELRERAAVAAAIFGLMKKSRRRGEMERSSFSSCFFLLLIGEMEWSSSSSC